MAVYRYATKDLSINNAKAFISTLNAEDGRSEKKSVVLYAAIGNIKTYPDEPTPVKPEDNEQYLQYEAHRQFIGAKKINPEDVSHVAVRYDWESGTVYSMYRDTDEDVYDRAYYVLTNQFNVYKCLNNNKGSPSTVMPTGFTTTPFSTSDGYVWKYMYTISLGDANKFLTSVHMPVKNIETSDGSVESDRQVAVKNASVNGAIEIIETVNLGAGYHQIANGTVEAGGKFDIRLSAVGDNPPSPIDNFYNGSSVYVISGTGSGQLRRVINYSGATKTFTVNTAFATTPNTDSKVIVSPTVTIIGDGRGAQAYSRLNSSGSVANVDMINVGSGYTRANALITANSIHGAGATANVIISPVGGHGSDPVRELAADKVMLNVQLKDSTSGVSANGNGYIPSNTEFRTISIIKDPILKCDSNNNFTDTQSIANTSNSPQTLRLTTRLQISYNQMDGGSPVNPLRVRDMITNERTRLKAELGSLQFVTELSPALRRNTSLSNALQGANADVVYIRKDETESDPSFYTVYINNVEGYADNTPFTKDDVILTSENETQIATVEAIKGPEANTFSGEILYVENVQAVTRDVDQTEDIKIVFDF